MADAALAGSWFRPQGYTQAEILMRSDMAANKRRGQAACCATFNMDEEHKPNRRAVLLASATPDLKA